MSNKRKSPRILFVDIETSPILGYVWGLWENNVALNQIKSDWHLLSFSAKFLGDPANKIIYADQRKAKNIEDDKELLKKIWKLLDESDIVIGQNSKNFDIKKLNARFILNGMKPPSSFRQLDTLQIAKKHFAFTSNKLEYLSEKLCTKYKKLKHSKFGGFELWRACLAGNKEAWETMRVYNCHDVLATEELYEKLSAWDNGINLNVYEDGIVNNCKCGTNNFIKYGYAYTSTGKFCRYQCKNCGSETRSKQNLLSKEKKKSLRAGSR